MNCLAGFFVVLLSIASAYSLPTNEYSHCDKACPDIYLPVCGYNGHNEYKVFPSDCDMDVENCRIQVKRGNVFMELPMHMCENKKSNYEAKVNSAVDIKSKTFPTLRAEPEPDYSHCNKGCPFNYAPVCGYNGNGEYKVFGNDCDMDMENCRVQVRHGHVYMELPMFSCEQKVEETKLARENCNKVCTMEYNPVCGYNGQKYHTFGNKCEYEVRNCEANFIWSLIIMSECPVPSKSLESSESLESSDASKSSDETLEVKKNCIKICPLNYDPVCGFDGKSTYHTYGNECEFEMMNCNSNYHLTMTKHGEC